MSNLTCLCRRTRFGVCLAASLLLLGASERELHAETPPEQGADAIVGDYVAYPLLARPWVQRAKLLADDGAENDEFGTAVAVEGAVALVGAPSNEDSGESAVYAFERDANGDWVQVQKLEPTDAAAGQFFGTHIALNGDTALISARGDAELANKAGAIYFFERDQTGVWAQTQKLSANDASSNRQLGRSVALSDDYALVGNRAEAAYFFEPDSNGDWAQTAKVSPQDIGDQHYFGRAAALHGDIALIGASGADGIGGDSGAAYIFERDSVGGWSQVQKFSADDGADDDSFGASVALGADFALIGAAGADGVGADSGAVYVFERGSSGSFAQVHKLVADDAAENGAFGRSVSFEGNLALIGASESAYLFERDTTGAWTQAQKLSADDGSAGDSFGNAVSLSGGLGIIGAYWDDENAAKSGSAYLFSANEPPVASDLSLSVDFDTLTSVTLVATDVDDDALIFTWTDPAHGTLSGSAPDLSYTPEAGYSGPDSFTFIANDGMIDSNTATVSITVEAASSNGDTTSETDTNSEPDTTFEPDITAEPDISVDDDIVEQGDIVSEGDTSSEGDDKTDTSDDGCGCSSAAGPSNALSMMLALLGVVALRLKRRKTHDQA